MAELIIAGRYGPTGTGKSWRLCQWTKEEWLPDVHNGALITNLPLHVDELCKDVASASGIAEHDLWNRVELISDATWASWIAEESGPWELFANRSIDGCHIIFDEIHTVCKKGKTSKAYLAQWSDWFAELRHQGATLEFASQNPDKVATEITNEVVERVNMLSLETERDPYFHIPLADWAELKAAFVGKYVPRVIEQPYSREPGRSGRYVWKPQKKKSFVRDTKYFKYYDSRSKPTTGQGQAGTERKREFEKRSKWGMVWWLYSRHCWAVTSRLFAVGFILFLCFGGGGHLMSWFLRFWTVGFVPGAKVEEVQEGENGAASDSESMPVGSVFGENSGNDFTVSVEEWEAAQEELKGLRDLVVEQSEIVMLTHRGIFSTACGFVPVGGRIVGGVHDAKTVLAIGYESRQVLLSDGSRLFVK